ncbi:MAG: AAA family ATPase [Actinobacteria bacterium]|nr:AAA family ATPase [Actinomycetota bacterium]
MFLKTLTLKGFKSFAERAALEFEPGVTVIVGPNGSGKSNVVDAVAWVLGAQGPSSMRGGKMDDVIFAGTPQRQALGRAEVSLTIDNSSHILPIDFSEVEITRTLFRSGESEYAINGVPCRLLDIQELLSDTGIGRNQHVIVGQGQVDAVLNARPEARRAIVEEAAGILKYRRRKEKAERRLEATEGSLLRLQDTLREVKRQLRPLERQADAARRHDAVESELKAIRLHLLGRQIGQLTRKVEAARTERSGGSERERTVRDRLAEIDSTVVAVEDTLGVFGDDVLDDAMVRAEALRERSKGLSALVDEKQAGLERARRAVADASVVESLRAELAAVNAQLRELAGSEEALAPLRAELEAAGERLAEAKAAYDDAVPSPDSDPYAAQAEAAREEAERSLAQADDLRRKADAEAHAWRARAEALALALDEARAAAGADRLEGLDGVLGPLVEHIEIAQGAELAVAAALGEAMRALVVRDTDGAHAAIEELSRGDAHALLLVIEGADHAVQGRLAPAGTRPLVELVTAKQPGLEGVLEALLDGVVYVESGWREALALALEHPALTVTTPAGERFRVGDTWRAGAAPGEGATRQSLEEARARAEEAEADQRDAEAALDEARRAFGEAAAAARDALRDRRDALDNARFAYEAGRDEVAELRTGLERREAAAAERRAVLEARRDEVAERLERAGAAPADEAGGGSTDLAQRALGLKRVARALKAHGEGVAALHARLEAARRARSDARRAASERLESARGERSTLERELEELRERLHRLELDDAEARMRLEAAVETCRRDFDCEPDAAVAAPAPDVPEGAPLGERARELERELRLMGPINPLALEEFEALQERHGFLDHQLEDVRESRRELRKVIRAVDEEISTVFARAFEDVQGHFADLFHRLFPGGQGAILLTDPGDMLETGIEIEARPSGKNVRRLSLLSGGERSLVALAFLFAVFRARPSPFYLLDEVEAALDDVNLHRFLELIHEFRDEVQLVIVSHQKRTMEAADVLYGISMPPGGSSRAVSERLVLDEPVRGSVN